MTRWRWAWVAWGVVFFAIEIPASLNRVNGDTLSEQVWAFLGFRNPLGTGVWLRRCLMGGFWVWLTAHFFFELDGERKQ